MSAEVVDRPPSPAGPPIVGSWPSPDIRGASEPAASPSLHEPDVGVPGDADRAGWERPALAAILLATAVLYLWGLGASGWANSFYSAAAQAGSSSWKAFLFGSSDAANSITVDKPPASLWVMGLSVRVFGLNSWSILVPQALMGVATVGLVWSAVRRWFGAGGAFLAAAVMALTPVAVLMFRFNNPDALLVLLMTGAAYTTLRCIEDGRRRWVVATGALLGFGFLTKQLQVLLVVPPFALAHLVSARGGFRRRVTDLLVAGGAMIVAAGWWIALVELWPASSRPYIGGSQHNSILELTLGYNGLGRLNGNETGSVTGGGGAGGGGAGGGADAGGMWGETGITRMFDGVMGGQIAWLLPAALASIAIALWYTRHSPRTDLQRASVIVWGGWLVVTAMTFSFMAGIFHEYYAVALAPAIAAVIGGAAHLLWQHRTDLVARMVGAAVVAGTAWWSAHLLARATDWNAWLVPVVLVSGLAAAAAMTIGWSRGPAFAGAASAVAVVACLAGPTAWSLQTAATPHGGSIVTAGPLVADGRRGAAGAFPGRGDGQFPVGQPPAGGVPGTGPAGGPPSNGNVRGGFPGAGAPGSRPDGTSSTGAGSANSPQEGGGGMGGLLQGSEPSDDVVALLVDDGTAFTWAAAAVGSQNAAGLQLATELPVMPIGGFNGSDPSPTLVEFQEYVAAGRIHYFVAGGGIGPGNGGSSSSSAIADWVSANFDSVTIDGTTLYDLTQPV